MCVCFGVLSFNYCFVISDLIERYAEYMAEDGFACVETVLCLLNVVGVRIVVYVLGNLVDTRQWVHDLHVLFGVFQHGAFQNVDIFYAFIFHKIRETFF